LSEKRNNYIEKEYHKNQAELIEDWGVIMSIIVDWGDADDTLLIWHFPHNWTSRDLQNAYGLANDILSKVNYEIDIIFDFGYTINPPQNTIQLCRGLLLHCPHNVRSVIILGRTRYWERIFSLVLRLQTFEHTVHFVQTVDEAYALLDV